MLTRAVVRPPAPNFAQGLTNAGLGQPDYKLALAQHVAYCAALEQCGLTLTRLESDPNYPDSTFVEDTAVLISALPHGRATAPVGCAVLTRPGADSRRGEADGLRNVFADFFPRVSEIQSPGTLDGGDVCEAGNHFFIGISERTNEAGANQLAELLAQYGYTSTLVDISVGHGEPGGGELARQLAQAALTRAAASSPMLHLKSGLAYLGDNCLVVTEALMGHEEFADYDVVRVTSKEDYAANCVRVNDYVLVAAGYPTFERKLRALNYQTIALGMSEFQKMDGGLSCLSLRF